MITEEEKENCILMIKINMERYFQKQIKKRFK
jgi:hypothetical protein